MRGSTKILMIFLLALVLLFIGYAIFYIVAGVYFSNALRLTRTSQSVTVNGNRYAVADGSAVDASGNLLHIWNQVEPLRLAYALEIARRSPLFDLSGTNPDELLQAVNDLASTSVQLSNVQKTHPEQEAVSSLYPIRFLRSLAHLEKARQSFLELRSETGAAAYTSAIIDTIQSGLTDADSFSQAFNIASEKKAAAKFRSFGGTITTPLMRSATINIQRRMGEVEREYRARLNCLRGLIFLCDSSWLLVKALSEPVDSVTDNRNSVYSDVAKMFNQMFPRYQQAGVTLAYSVCNRDMSGTYHLYIGTVANTDLTFIRPINELLFIPTRDHNGPVLRELEQRGVYYSLINPNAFYLCPETAVDTARAFAIIQTVQFAKSHPSIAATERKELLHDEQFPDERDAIQYLSAALTEILPQDLAFEGLLSLVHMFNHNSAALEKTVQFINAIMRSDLTHYRAGVGFDLSAETLFLTHSAFPSLFLAHNKTAGVTPVILRTEQEKDDELAKQYVSYTNLQRQLSREVIIENIRNFIDFENLTDE